MNLSNLVHDMNTENKSLFEGRRALLKAMAVSAAGGLLLPPTFAFAAKHPNSITDLRLWTAPDHTRVVFDLNQVARHSLFHLRNPDRLVVDLQDITLKMDPSRLKVSDPVVSRIRTGQHSPNMVRTVFELTSEVRPRSFILNASGAKTPRLVLDLFRKDLLANENRRGSIEHKRKVNTREAMIAIDPGHGGEDPGAVGPDGTLEKDIALQVAQRLAKQINGMPGFKARLTRTGDYYVSLRQRVDTARSFDADLFISLHADAFRTSSAQGASVYCLSERGKPDPDRAIRNLVERENSTDLIGGVDLDQVSDPEVRGILMDLSQRDSLNRALVFGKNLLKELGGVSSTTLHYKNVKQAGFAVLKAPDMPSVLVEMAFLSNKKEERMLRQRHHQESLARALASGTRRFVESSGLA